MAVSRTTVAARLGAVCAIALASCAAGARADLLDGRAYEQVSVPRKLGYGVGTEIDPAIDLGVDPDGDRVLFKGLFPLPPSETASTGAFQVTRTDAGWRTIGLYPPPGPLQAGIGIPASTQNLMAATPDQRTIVFWDNSTAPYGGLFIRRADGTIQRIADGGNTIGTYGENKGQVWGAGISDDGRRVIIASSQRLVPGLPAGSNDILYEWIDDGAAGSLRVVNRTDDEPLTLIAAANAELGGSTSSPGTSGRGAGMRGLRHAISDGSDGHDRIFFQTPAPTSNAATTAGPVYMREDGARTVEISAPEGANVQATQRRYLDASADGSHVFFWANARLTDDADAAGGIYRFDVAADGSPGDLVFVDVAPALASGPPSALASEDGTVLLYQRSGEIVVDTNGEKNVVMAGNVISGRFIDGDSVTASVGIRDDRCPSASITPDGRYAVFSATSPEGIAVYRYDVAARELRRLSTSPTMPPGNWGTNFIGACNENQAPRPIRNRLITDDGQRVYFSTSAPLVPADNNSTVDVYEWYDDDSPDGRLALVSRGTGVSRSGFAGTDRTGANVFFVTADRLVPQDGDAAYDLYTARIDGGFPVEPTRPACSADTCQGAGPSPTPPLVVASEVYFGAGDLAEEPPATGGVKRVRVLKRTVTGSRIGLRVRVPQRGTLTFTGSRIRSRRVSVAGAATRTIQLRLSRPAMRSLRRAGRATVRIRIRYVPADGASSSVVLTIRTRAQGGRS